MHEIWRTIRHQTDNLVSNHLTVSGICDMLFNNSLVVGLLHVEMFAFSNKLLWKLRGHDVFEFKKNIKKLFSKNTQILLLQKL